MATAAAFAGLLVAGVVVSSWMAVRANRAEQEARAVNDFLQNDLLAQASANRQARSDTRPDPDLKVRTALDRASEGIEGKFAAQPLVEASIRQTIGDTYRDLGLYTQAQRQTERALGLRRRVLGEKHLKTLQSMTTLAELYQMQGEYAKAEALLTETSELQQRVLGREHPQTLLSTSDLAAVLYGEGKYSQAEALFTRVLGMARDGLGEQHPTTLEAMSGLAAVYYRERKFAQGEQIFATVLEVRRRVLGEAHPDTLKTMQNLGGSITLKATGRERPPPEGRLPLPFPRVVPASPIFPRLPGRRELRTPQFEKPEAFSTLVLEVNLSRMVPFD